MPPKRSIKKRSATPKGDTSDDGGRSGGVVKKPRLENGHSTNHHSAPSSTEDDNDDDGIVLRAFYPPEMSNARAQAYNNNTIPRPIEQLTTALEDTAEARKRIEPSPGGAIVHWFRWDLRLADNRALSLASARARAAGIPLLCLYVVSPEDLEAHLTAPARVDFALRTLGGLRRDLAALDIPLHVETVPRRRDVVARVLELVRDEWHASHLFANVEYEVDELRRDACLVRRGVEGAEGGRGGGGVAVELVHDTCVVAPGTLTTGTGRQYAVYTPWFRAWLAHLHANPDLLTPFEKPERNPPETRERFAGLFDNSEIPEAPENKRLGDEGQAERLCALWPAGEHAAMERLRAFCDDKVVDYAARRNFPAAKGATSSLSVHFAAGTLSARTAVRMAKDSNKTKRLDGGDEGIRTWISEVAWRDFYKHVLAHWPYIWFVFHPLVCFSRNLPKLRRTRLPYTAWLKVNVNDQCWY